ncbi:tyrosine-type recombinase/integrase [Kordia sp.]|uniref:tyrosine-type recombinase/integrase n=1 Tax=Kordia sp. TaxID=1965332 RepID=UPI003D2E2215
MATVNFLYRSTRKRAALTLRLLFRDTQSKDHAIDAKTQYFVDTEYWKLHNKRTKDANIKNKQVEVKAHLIEIENFVRDAFINENEKNVDKEWLKDQIHLFYNPIQEKQQSELLTDAIQSIIDEAPTKKNAKGGIGLSKSRINSYKSLKRMIAEYQKPKKFKVKDINVRFSNDFLNYLLNTKNYQKSYALKKITDLKTVCRNAELNGIETNIQYNKIESTKPKNENILYLTTNELEAIENTVLLNEAHKNARKWLLLGCDLGQRGGDLLELTKDNFVTRDELEVIELQQQKTGKNITIPVLETTKKILESGLPHKISIQKFNKYIKEVCKLAGIDEMIQDSKITVIELGNGNTQKRKIEGTYQKWELMSSHVCRRSFATNQYGELPTPLIMQITGHSSEKMLLNYIGKNSLDYARQIADFYTIQALKKQKESNLKVVSKKASNQN